MDATNVLRQIGCKPEYPDVKNFLLIDREIQDVKRSIAGLYGRKKLLEEEKERLWSVMREKARHGEVPFREEAEE